MLVNEESHDEVNSTSKVMARAAIAPIGFFKKVKSYTSVSQPHIERKNVIH